jgi:phosphopantothenoylcysteine decarboxylase/phosphopantothenate--cysteine ligase
MKTIVIGVTSSISCYKVIELIRRLKGFDVEVIISEKASKLVNKREFERVIGRKVHVSLFYKDWDYKKYLKQEKSEHISLADKADLFLIAPATANTIGKIANGVADDLLTTSVIATNAPVLICPAMNCKMWENRIVQGNVEKLRQEGYYFVRPERGRLACGYKGVGRLATLERIERVVIDLISKKGLLKGKRIIVTAGGTTEEIDPVRVITNKSSGKMGIYIAEEAAKMGAKVTLIRGRTDIEPFGKIRDIRVESVDDMYREIGNNVGKNDVIIHAAAVSDFTVDREGTKIRSGKKLVLELKPAKKIINEIKKINKKIKLVGFKAEHDVSKEELIKEAKVLLRRSNADFIVANDVSKGVFGSEENDVYVVERGKARHIKGSKREIAGRILQLIK